MGLFRFGFGAPQAFIVLKPAAFCSSQAKNIESLCQEKGVVLIKTTAEPAPSLLLGGAGRGRPGRPRIWGGGRISPLGPGSSFASRPVALPGARVGWKASLAGMSPAELASLKLALPAVLRLAGTCWTGSSSVQGRDLGLLLFHLAFSLCCCFCCPSGARARDF